MSVILKELERLKQQHCGSNPHSSVFQPNEAEQRRLIMKNAGDRLVSVVIKREAAKYVFNQKQKLEEELKREQLELASASEEVKEEETISVKTPVSAGKSRKLMRKQPTRKGGKRYSVFRGNISSGMIISRGTRLTGCLQYNTNGDAVLQELQEQGLDQYKDAKKIFDFLAQSFDTGKICQFHPRRPQEEVDLSQFNTQVSLSSVTRLEDLNQIRKKNGIMLLFDPSINTFGETITLRVKYMKFIDLNTEEEVIKHYTFSSNGNYFHMTLIKDNFRHNEDQSGRQTAPGGARTGLNNANSDNNNNNQSNGSSGVLAFSERHHSHNSIPGWNTRPPIFIPAPKCVLQIVDLASYSQNAPLTNNLTRLRLYAISCAGARAGIRRVTETLDAFMVQQTANITLPNGRSSLNHACLYGNIEVQYTCLIRIDHCLISLFYIGGTSFSEYGWKYQSS